MIIDKAKLKRAAQGATSAPSSPPIADALDSFEPEASEVKIYVATVGIIGINREGERCTIQAGQVVSDVSEEQLAEYVSKGYAKLV